MNVAVRVAQEFNATVGDIEAVQAVARASQKEMGEDEDGGVDSSGVDGAEVQRGIRTGTGTGAGVRTRGDDGVGGGSGGAGGSRVSIM